MADKKLFKKTENGLEVTKFSQKKRFWFHYHDLFPFPKFKNNNLIISALKEKLGEVNFRYSLIVTCRVDIKKPVFAYGFMSLNDYTEYDLMSVERLRAIELGQDGVFSSISSFCDRRSRNHVLGVHLGYDENYHSRHGGVIAYTRHMRNMTRKQFEKDGDNLPIWVFFKGTEEEFIEKYAYAAELFQQSGHPTIEINLNPGVVLKDSEDSEEADQEDHADDQQDDPRYW